MVELGRGTEDDMVKIIYLSIAALVIHEWVHFAQIFVGTAKILG